jgi:hypothetical protein
MTIFFRLLKEVLDWRWHLEKVCLVIWELGLMIVNSHAIKHSSWQLWQPSNSRFKWYLLNSLTERWRAEIIYSATCWLDKIFSKRDSLRFPYAFFVTLKVSTRQDSRRWHYALCAHAYGPHSEMMERSITTTTNVFKFEDSDDTCYHALGLAYKKILHIPVRVLARRNALGGLRCDSHTKNMA